MPPRLSVIVCSYNGAEGLDRCLSALEAQTIAGALQVIVVDDGSTDGTGAIGDAHRVTTLRHARNRGLAAARNTGLREARAEIVAFLDDDCEAAPDWAEQVLAAYGDDASTIGVGGPIVPRADPSFFGRFLQRNNPLQPIEVELHRSDRLAYRLGLYLRRQWGRPRRRRRQAYALVGANMSFRRSALADVGDFDGRFTFGADDVEISLRVAEAHPAGRLVFDERPVVIHRFDARMRDGLRRSRGYGRGTANLYRQRRARKPALFPAPLLVLGLAALAVGRRDRRALAAALLTPHACFPAGLLTAVREGRLEPLADAYLLTAQEAAGNLGVVEGLWRTRRRRG